MFLIFVKIIDINRWKCGNDLIGWQTFEKFDLEMNKCHDVTIIDIYQLKCCLNSFYTVIVYLYNNDIYNTFIIYIYIYYICLYVSTKVNFVFTILKFTTTKTADTIARSVRKSHSLTLYPNKAYNTTANNGKYSK